MKTPLYNQHMQLGAKMIVFAGWEMPLYYSGIVNEVSAVRSTAGIFDLSHMGEVMVSGDKALDLIQCLCTNDASVLDVGVAQYTLMCDEYGGIIDDLIAYRLETELYMLVVNAANTASDFQWMAQHNKIGAECHNRSDGIGLIAVQGPSSVKILQSLVSYDLAVQPRFTVKQGRVGETDARIARTGYTGEDGFEVYCESKDSANLWQDVSEAGREFGAVPAGLGARDVLRVEAGYPLYGQELTRTISPVEARLMWTVKPAKGDFIGREAILEIKEHGPEQILVGLTAKDKCIPRHDNKLIMDEGREIGEVTSGTFSPTLGRGIGLAYVETEYSQEKKGIDVMLRGKACRCEIVPIPHYRSGQQTSVMSKQSKGVSSDS